MQRDLGKCVPGSRKRKCKGPKATVWLGCLSHRAGRTIDEKEMSSGQKMLGPMDLWKDYGFDFEQDRIPSNSAGKGVTWSSLCFNRTILAARLRVSPRVKQKEWDH